MVKVVKAIKYDQATKAIKHDLNDQDDQNDLNDQCDQSDQIWLKINMIDQITMIQVFDIWYNQ